MSLTTDEEQYIRDMIGIEKKLKLISDKKIERDNIIEQKNQEKINLQAQYNTDIKTIEAEIENIKKKYQTEK